MPDYWYKVKPVDEDFKDFKCGERYRAPTFNGQTEWLDELISGVDFQWKPKPSGEDDEKKRKREAFKRKFGKEEEETELHVKLAGVTHKLKLQKVLKSEEELWSAPPAKRSSSPTRGAPSERAKGTPPPPVQSMSSTTRGVIVLGVPTQEQMFPGLTREDFNAGPLADLNEYINAADTSAPRSDTSAWAGYCPCSIISTCQTRIWIHSRPSSSSRLWQNVSKLGGREKSTTRTA